MQSPGLPLNEGERLRTLNAAHILDTPCEERFDRLTRVAQKLFDVPIALISLVDENRQWFKSSVGLEMAETPRDVSFCGHAILDDSILVVPDAARDERFRDNPLVVGEPYVRFYAGYPLTVWGGNRLGTLCILDHQPREFGDSERRLLTDLGTLVVEELESLHLATLDELTSLVNRRGFLAMSQQALNLCRRLGGPASVFFFDLDGLKKVNDSYGHAVGDEALCSFAELLRETFRDSDVVSRLGGDEFVVFLVNAGRENCQHALDRLERATQLFNRRSGKPWQLSYSVGLAHYDSALHDSVDDLMREADSRMYWHKARLEH